MDLRERVYRAYCEREGSVGEVAWRFGVSEGVIYKLRRQKEARGHIQPLGHAGGHPPALDGRREQVLEGWVREKPDATLGELVGRMKREEKVGVSESTVSRVLRKLGLGRKKKELRGSRT